MEIRPLITLDEMEQAERLQKIIWDTDDLEVLPVHTLHAIQHNGGPVLGAFAGGQMVGFVLGILGTIQDKDRLHQPAAERLKMYSVVAGVLAAYQNRGVGYALKLAQREFALKLGLELITWTYDPLESLNGRLNVGKLGVICHTYLRNHHGELAGLNAGLPTDRFEVEWWINSDRVRARLAGGKRPSTLNDLIAQGAVLTNKTNSSAIGFPVPPEEIILPDGEPSLVEIPLDFQAIKKKDTGLALFWREHTRRLFEELFRLGYTVTDFVYERDGTGNPHSFYVLTSNSR